MAPAQSKPIQVDGADKVCFLDLPPEIRNTVYELSLVHAGQFQEVAASFRPGTAKIEVGARLWQPGLQPQLLATCKQIYEETVPVLYGNSLFDLRADPERHVGTRRTSPVSDRRLEAVKHIRLIRITHYRKQSQYTRLFDEVKATLLNLTSVRVSHVFVRNFRTPRTMSEALLPLLEQLGSQSADAKNEAVDKITFELAPATAFWWWSSNRKLTQAFANETKDFLRASLT